MSDLVVVDASVAMKWFVDEDDSDRAETLLAADIAIAPAIILSEVGNGIWSKRRSAGIDGASASRFIGHLTQLLREVVPLDTLMAEAMKLASTSITRSMTASISRLRVRGAVCWSQPTSDSSTSSQAKITPSPCLRTGRHDPLLPHRRPARHPGDGPRLRRRHAGAPCAALGRGEAFPGRGDARGRRARHGRDLCQRGCRRLGPVAARCGADLRGAVDRLPDGRGLYLDPQHVRLDDRPLRLGRAAPALAAAAVQHGAAVELLPDRAGRRLGRRGAEDARGPRRRSLRPRRAEAVHLRRRRLRPLCRDGAHRRGRPRRASRRWWSRRARPACPSAPTRRRWAGTPSRRAP